jgi:MFS family permease
MKRLMHAADPIVFFLFAVCWGFGYAGATMQYGIIAKDVFPTDLRGPAFAGVSCAAMIGMAGGGRSRRPPLRYVAHVYHRLVGEFDYRYHRRSHRHGNGP